jgi:CRISPR-associated protein Csx10
MLRLRIELLSPLCAGSGVGRPGIVDRDVVYDSCGLPILPARRLKGLLLDAYRGILASEAVKGRGLPESDLLFGAPGATDREDNKHPGLLQLGSADLADSPDLAPWLSGVTTRQGSPIVRDDVTASFTDIRRQTKIDRRFGRAEDDTLRATRTILSGLVFFAPVGSLPEEADRNALALAAAGVQEMGTSRSRGFGRVKCRLEERSGNAWQDLSEPAIQWLETKAAIDRGTKPELERRTDAAAQPTGDLHRLRYRLQLKASAVIPRLAGDPFTVFTEHYVPGSTIRGLLAARYLASNKPDGRFYQLLCVDVRFLPAAPVEKEGRAEFALTTVPHSVRRVKGSDLLVDLALRVAPEDDDEEEEDLQFSRESGWARLDRVQQGQTTAKHTIATELQYHHARASDPRIQRALGAEQKHWEPYGLTQTEAGALFTYESVPAGQVFLGEMLGCERDLSEIRKLIPGDGATVMIGRSRGAQYGGAAQWSWLDAAPTIVKPVADEDEEDPESEPNTLIVTLVSPLLGSNRWGHPAPEFPAEQLAITGLSLKKSFVRVEWQGGYLSHQGLPRQQTPALAPGSVFVFDLNTPLSSERLAEAESRSYGFRVEDGFGRIVLRQFFVDAETRWKLIGMGLKEPKPRQASDAELRAPEGPPRRLALSILKRQVVEKAEQEALRLADEADIEKTLNKLSPHLLARLMTLIEARTLPEFVTVLEPGGDRGHLREAALGRLRRAEVRHENLLQFLKVRSSEPWKAFMEFADPVYKGQLNWFNVLDGAEKNPLVTSEADEAFATHVIKTHLKYYLKGLALRLRKPPKDDEGAGA